MKKQIKLTQAEYDETLDRLIPFLNQFPSKQGKEGYAFFIGDEYVVKAIVNSPRQEQMAQYFDCYIKEQQKFADKGYLLPRLYSYKVVNSMNIDGSTNISFYILEDKFNGNDIFTRSSNNFFQNFKMVYGEEYRESISAEQKEFAYKDMETYISGFIMQNIFLMGLSDDKFDKLVLSVYKMFKEGEYSIPDIHPGNLMVNRTGFNVIDNYMLDRKYTSKYLNKMQSETFLTTRFLNIFDESKKIRDVLREPEILQNKDLEKLQLLQKENMFYTQAVIKKLMLSIKRCISQNEPLDINAFISILRKRLSHYLDRNSINEMVLEIERE